METKYIGRTKVQLSISETGKLKSAEYSTLLSGTLEEMSCTIPVSSCVLLNDFI